MPKQDEEKKPVRVHSATTRMTVRISAIIFLFLFPPFAPIVWAQHDEFYKYDHEAALKRKKNKLRSTCFIRENYDAATGKYLAAIPPDTVGYEFYDTEGRITLKWEKNCMKHEPFMKLSYDITGNIVRALFYETDSAWGYEVKYFYDGNGNILKEVEYLVNDGVPELDYSADFTYDESGRLTRKRVYFALAPGLLMIHETMLCAYTDSLVVSNYYEGDMERKSRVDSAFTMKNGWKIITRFIEPDGAPNKEILERPSIQTKETMLRGDKVVTVEKHTGVTESGHIRVYETDSTIMTSKGFVLEHFFIDDRSYIDSVYSKPGPLPTAIDVYGMLSSPQYRIVISYRYYK